MNILFVTVFEVSEQKGGTERTTARISNELRKKGHKCFSLFEKAIGQQFQKHNLMLFLMIVHFLK